DRAAGVLTLARAHQSAKTLSDDDKAELMIELGLFTSAASGAVSSLESAAKGNAGGETRARLETPAKEFAALSERLAAEMKATALQMRDDATRAKLDLRPITELYRRTAASTDKLWLASASELDRLLSARIGGLTSRLWKMLGIAATVTLAALGMA